MRRAKATGEDGLTLIELMIAIAVLSLVIGPITASFLIGFLETTASQQRVNDSTSAQLLARYLYPDVQSAETVAFGGAECLPPDFDSADDTVRLVLSWTDLQPVTGAEGGDVYVSYVERTDGQRHVERVECSGPAPTSTLVVQNLALGGFTPTCVPDCSTGRLVVSVEAHGTAPDEASSYEAFDVDLASMRRVNP